MIWSTTSLVLTTTMGDALFAESAWRRERRSEGADRQSLPVEGRSGVRRKIRSRANGGERGRNKARSGEVNGGGMVDRRAVEGNGYDGDRGDQAGGAKRNDRSSSRRAKSALFSNNEYMFNTQPTVQKTTQCNFATFSCRQRSPWARHLMNAQRGSPVRRSAGTRDLMSAQLGFLSEVDPAEEF